MMVTANMAVIQIRISEAEFENPDIKMKWPCQWLTRLNGPLDPWTEQMRFLKPTKMLMPTQYSQVTFHIFFFTAALELSNCLVTFYVSEVVKTQKH